MSSVQTSGLPASGGAGRFILAALIVFLMLGGLAFVWDSSRMLKGAHEEVLAADEEVLQQEKRLVNVLRGIPDEQGAIQTAIGKYEASARNSAADRRAAFLELSATANRVLPSGASAAGSDPLRRRLYDEIAGSLNRREFAMRRFYEVQSGYNSLSRSTRGTVARTFSSGLPEQLSE